jgi:hypothetical protein
MHTERDLESEMKFISNSLHMLPPWREREWWMDFSRISDHSLGYLQEKLFWITQGWREADGGENFWAGDRAKYVLVFFDNPDLHGHLDAVQPTWNPPHRGGTGRRWAEEICAAAWRVVVATEPSNVYSNNFSVAPWSPEEPE